MDDFHTRTLNSLRERHENTVRECALRIQEHVGFVLDRIGRGETVSIDHYLRGISMAAPPARILVGTLNGIDAAEGEK